MDLFTIIDLVLEILKNCPEPDEGKVVSILRRGGLRVALPLRRQFRREGLRGTELQDAVHVVLQSINDATDLELKQAVIDARTEDK